MMPTKTGAEYQGWTIMTNCSAGRNHRGVLLQSKFLNFLFAAEKYQHLMVKKLTYIDMVLLLCFSQKSNWWVSTFVAPLLTAHTQRKAHIDVYWLMFCMGESRLDGHRQSDKLQLCSLSMWLHLVFGVRTIWVIARHWQLVSSVLGQKHTRIDRNLERKSPRYHGQTSFQLYLAEREFLIFSGFCSSG